LSFSGCAVDRVAQEMGQRGILTTLPLLPTHGPLAKWVRRRKRLPAKHLRLAWGGWSSGFRQSFATLEYKRPQTA
jgi:hypothetical protein